MGERLSRQIGCWTMMVWPLWKCVRRETKALFTCLLRHSLEKAIEYQILIVPVCFGLRCWSCRFRPNGSLLNPGENDLYVHGNLCSEVVLE